MSKRSTKLRVPGHRRRVTPVVVTRTFDRGHEMRVVSRAAGSPDTDPPALEGVGSDGSPPVPAPGRQAYELPRSAWPVPTRPVTPKQPQGTTGEPGEGNSGDQQADLADKPVAQPEPAKTNGTGQSGAAKPGGNGQPPATEAKNGKGQPATAKPRNGNGATVASQPAGNGEPTGRAVSDDDLEADIAAIVNRGKGGIGGGARTPGDEAGPGVPPGRNKQAIFDQIAASMSLAKSYDLGSVELERRFDDFDRLQDAVPSAPARSRSAAATRPRPTAGPGGGQAGAADVLEDLDAIRSQAQTEDIPLDPGIGGRSISVDALEPGDIILSTTSHPLSDQIRAVTGSEVSHAAVYVGNGRLVEAIEGGVILRSVDTAVEDDTLAVAYRHRDLTPAKAALMIPFLEDHARKRTPFDHWGLIQVAPGQLARAICNRMDGPARQACLAGSGQLKVGTNDENTFFCSELVLEAFKLAGLSISKLEPSWSAPGQIAELRFNGLLDYIGHLKA